MQRIVFDQIDTFSNGENEWMKFTIHIYTHTDEQQHQRWSPHPPAIESKTQASLQVQQENENLRAAVADMRHEMEKMRTTAAITAQHQQYQQQAGGVRVPSPSSYLSTALGGDRSPPPIPPPPPPPSFLTTEARLDQLASENRKLKEDNKKLVGTCVSYIGRYIYRRVAYLQTGL